MSVSAQTIHYGFSNAKERLAVHHPLTPVEIIESSLEGVLLFQVDDFSGKSQLSFLLGLLAIGEELSPETSGRGPLRG